MENSEAGGFNGGCSAAEQGCKAAIAQHKAEALQGQGAHMHIEQEGIPLMLGGGGGGGPSEKCYNYGETRIQASKCGKISSLLKLRYYKSCHFIA